MENLKVYRLITALVCAPFISFSQGEEIENYKNYDFVPGEKILLDDQLLEDKIGATPLLWKLEGGKALVEQQGDVKYISIKEYYTKLTPILKNLKMLPDNFTIEYDTWLADGYDGNPGIEIHLENLDNEILITPNKHELSVSFPQNDRAAQDNPEEYFGENKFYNRWVHISIAYSKRNLVVYLDQYKMITVSDCKMDPKKLVVSGNASGDMPIFFKNFKLATGIPPKKILFEKGKFITHAIKFDVNKSLIKAESMGVLNDLVAYMKENANVKFEIGGHTDSDGSPEANQKLSQQRAEAVRKQLIKMGIAENRLSAKGLGENSPISENTTVEGKANNRRVEFTVQP